MTLNKQQQQAVDKIIGPVRIIAGPGTGKTRTITSKIGKILTEGHANSDEILFLTFTNKAAKEAKSRIEIEVGVDNLPKVFTYHSFCAWIIRREAKWLGFSENYTILDMSEQKAFIKKVANSLDIDVPTTWMADFKKIRDNEELDPNYPPAHELYIKKMMKLYSKAKRDLNALDFDDLILEVDRLFIEFPEIANKYKSKFRFVFVDEFQDTSNTQYRILKNLTDRNSNLTIVGDPDQNIYSWRGSNISLILNFDKDYDNVDTISLIKNYRSTPAIIKAANNLIKNNTQRINIEQQSHSTSSTSVIVKSTPDQYMQAQSVVNEIQKLALEGVSYSDIAIIYRNNFSSKHFEWELARKQISYKLIGGFKFLDRVEVKEVLKFLRFIIFRENYAFQQIANVPRRGFGPKSELKLISDAKEAGISVWEFVKENKIDKLSGLVDSLKIAEENVNSKMSYFNTLNTLLNDIGYFDFYKDTEQDKMSNIRVILQQISQEFTDETSTKAKASEFFRAIALISSSDANDEMNKVSLLTAHASKGTEYEVVFCVDWNAKILPSERSKNTQEERRLAYVAMTRAKEKLFILTSSSYLPSMFIAETKLMVQPTYSVKDISVSRNLPEGLEIPDNFARKKTAKIGDIIFHRYNGKGIITNIVNNLMLVNFDDNKIEDKYLLIGHESIFIQQ